MRNSSGAGQANPEMNVVRHATHAIGFASSVSRHRGKIGVEMRTQPWLEKWQSILGAENDVTRTKLSD